jgi:hypothetical protein
MDLNMIAARLNEMRQQLSPFMDALVKGAPEEMQERNVRLTEMERILESLRIIVRDLQNEEHLLQAMKRNLGKTTSENRWQANQSLDQRQRNLQNAKKQAMDLAEVVRQLMIKNGFLSGFQIGMNVKDLMENLEKSAEQGHAIHQIMVEMGVPTISMAQTEAASVSSIIPVLIFAIYGIRRIAGKGQQSSSAAGR